MALPTLTVEFAPASTPLATSPTWVDITAYVLSFDTNRGFGNELDTVADAGTASITLNNKDRRFDPTYAAGPYFTNLKPGKQVRIRATYNAVTYDIFRGHIEGYPQTYPGGMFNTEVTLPCVDGTQFLARAVLENETVLSSPGKLLDKGSKISAWWRRTPERNRRQVDDLSQYSDLISYSKPWAYWPASGDNAAETVHDAAGDKHLIPKGVGGGEPDISTVAAAELVTGDEYPPGAMQCLRADSNYFRTVGLDVPQFKFLTVEALVKFTNTPASIPGNMRVVSGPMNTGGASPIFSLYFDSSDDLNAEIRLRGAAGVNAWVVAATLTANTTYHVALVYDSGAGTIGGYLNGVGGSGSVGSAGTNLADPGNNLNIFVGGQPNAANTGYLSGYISHVAIYNRVLTATTLLAHYNALPLGFTNGQSATTRIGAVLNGVGWPAGWRDLNTGTSQTLIGRRWSNQSAMDEIRTTEEANFGRCWIAPDGNVTTYERDWRNHADLSSSAATFGDDPTENRYTDIGELQPADDTYLYNRITSKSAAGEGVQVSEDSTSQAAYGLRGLDLGELILDTAASASSLVSALITRYKDPQPRFREITIEPEADPTNLWPKVLDYDLCEHITIKRRPMGSADTAITQASHIERISHSCTVSTGNWVTRWTVSPR